MGSQWAVSFRSASAVSTVGTAEKQDQNKYGEWEHQDPLNLIPAQRAPPLSSSMLWHVQGAGRFPPPNFARVCEQFASTRVFANAWSVRLGLTSMNSLSPSGCCLVPGPP